MPISQAPMGRTTKPIAKMAAVWRSCAVGSPCGKKELAQFGFYRQLQEAAAQAPAAAKAGANTLSVGGAVRTWFRIAEDGSLISAFNDLSGEDGKAIRQTFDFTGWWHDDGAIFPRRMVMKRSGEPYFTLNVESFDAR